MSERDIGAEILDGIKEIQAHRQGRLNLRTTRLSERSMTLDKTRDPRKKLSP